MNNSMPALILASASPRRKTLLEQAGLDFEVVPSDVDEKDVPTLPPLALAVHLAKAKALSVAQNYPHSWVIGADTMVVTQNMILGKPEDEPDARRMLVQLSGKSHSVITGFCIGRVDVGHWQSEAVTTQVTFKSLSQTEIDWYVHTREPFDKAGAYAIQGLGTFLVRTIHGSYTNVVGLPVCEIIEGLIAVGAAIPSPAGFQVQQHQECPK